MIKVGFEGKVDDGARLYRLLENRSRPLLDLTDLVLRIRMWNRI